MIRRIMATDATPGALLKPFAQLGLNTNTSPGYEDRLYYLWKEANQPANVDWLT